MWDSWPCSIVAYTANQGLHTPGLLVLHRRSLVQVTLVTVVGRTNIFLTDFTSKSQSTDLVMSSVTIFSLIETIASTTKACWAVGSSVHGLARDAQNVDDSMRRFNDETGSLQAVLDGIYSSLGKIAKLPTWMESDRDREVWTAVHGSTDECNQYLTRLVGLLAEVREDSVTGSMASTMRVYRLTIGHGDLDKFRAQIQDYKESLQMAHLVINM